MASDPPPDPLGPAPQPDPAPQAGASPSGKHQATLQAIFSRPTRASIKWHDVEALLVALGGTVYQRAGSRVVVVLNGLRLHLHTPHPQPEMKKPQVKDVRDFLITLGY